MASHALLTIFVLYLFVHILNALGAEQLNEVLWRIYNRFPTATSGSAHEQLRLKKEVVRLKRELGAISAQDDFARWAKLRRQHDKLLAEHDKCGASMNDAKASFDRTVTSIRWVSTNGLRLFFQFWYAREPIFWLPKGWVPNFVEWILAFPKAPRGGVSVQIWGIACASVIHMASEAIVAAYILMSRSVAEKEQKGRQTHVMAGQGISMPERSQAKKEL